MPNPASKSQRSLPSSLKTWLQKPHPRLKKLAVAYALLCTAVYFQQQRLMFFPSVTLANTPSLYQLPYEDAWIPVTDKQGQSKQLHGWWIPAENPEAPVLLYFHHNAANIGANVSQALQFYKLGYTIFLFDYRGFGQSEGSFPTEAQVYEDAAAACVGYHQGISQRRQRIRNTIPPGNVMGQPGISAIAEQASFGIARRLSAPLFALAGTVAPFSVALLSQAQTSIPSSQPRSPLVTQAQFPAREPSADKQAQVLAKAVLSDRDQQTFQAILTQAQTQKLHQQPFPTIIQTIAEQFIGATYTAGLLDQGDTEELLVSLSDFDCVLFIEAVLALAQSVATQNPSEVALVETVEDYRYRDGQLGDYCDRLHYFSDWIFDNARRGNLGAITGLNTDPLNKPLTFMSSHRNSYPQLKASAEAYDCIAQRERKLNQMLTPTMHRYIPTHRIRANQDLLQAGDVVAIATSIPGLDVTHTGLAYENSDGSIGLIHAAPGSGVKLSPDLRRYVERVDSAVGIMVARPSKDI